MNDHTIATREQWLAARLDLLEAEKAFTRQRDALTRRRMAMPWERVEKSYRFEGPNGVLSLADIFDGRSQLIVYHLMFAPDWDEACKSCSFWADNFNGIPVHLNHRDVTFTAVSRAPLPKIIAYRKRMGWSFPWVSSDGSDFNFDYQASFAPEQIAEGKAYYNYRIQPNTVSDQVGISAVNSTSNVDDNSDATITDLRPQASDSAPAISIANASTPVVSDSDSALVAALTP